MAVWSGHRSVVTRLIALGADVNHRTASGEAALHFAMLKDFVEIAEQLIDHGADVNVQTTAEKTDMYDGFPEVCGESPLHIAARHGHAEMVRLLIARGARTDVTDHEGETPYQWAHRYDQAEIEALLA